MVVVIPLGVAGCVSDSDSPSVPTTLAPRTGTVPPATVGAGVPLEPGSNLPPVEGDDEEGDDEVFTTTTG
jgi:hypothetical protein